MNRVPNNPSALIQDAIHQAEEMIAQFGKFTQEVQISLVQQKMKLVLLDKGVSTLCFIGASPEVKHYCEELITHAQKDCDDLLHFLAKKNGIEVDAKPIHS